ncbi:MAG: thioredoxin domain-containing protein [Novosphingobium sp.]|nr:thioredoxin domain-containing protein [Novosphingobium sp.]
MRVIRLAAIALAAVLSIAAHPNWTATIAVTPAGSHVLGNPAAPVKVVEYVSYTCSHCADFQRQSDTAMRLGYVGPGKVSVEVRHFIRDPIDLTVAMLANCGDPKNFFYNHNAFLVSQEGWMQHAQSATAAQKQRWTTGPTPARLRAIAGDFGFYAVLERRGITRTAQDRCLADEAMMRRIVGQMSNGQDLGVEGTPSFLLNGELLAGTHDWQSLELQIKARL